MDTVDFVLRFNRVLLFAREAVRELEFVRMPPGDGKAAICEREVEE